MLNTKEKGIILYIINHCERVLTKVKDITKEVFLENDDLKEIVCFNILQIGELAKSLSDEFISNYNGVPWLKIKGLRDRIVHGYGTVDLGRIWNTATEDVEPLKNYCVQIIEESGQ